MYWFTADEHYYHKNIIKYCNRPFPSVEAMNAELIKRHNQVVKDGDTVVHAGDFCWGNVSDFRDIRGQLFGSRHIFLRGSHDHWQGNQCTYPQIWEYKEGGHFVVVCHYAMRTWARSHHNSWQLFGHSHGKLEPQGKQLDIGVDSNNFYPMSWSMIKHFMALKPDNLNYVRS